MSSWRIPRGRRPIVNGGATTGATVLIRLDGSGTLQGQIARSLRNAVLAAELPPRRRLPGSRALARQLGVSRNVVMFALEQLIAEGYLTARPGSGTYVAEALPERICTTAQRTPSAAAQPAARGIVLSRFARRMTETAIQPKTLPPPPFDFRYGLAVPDARSIAAWRRIQSRLNRRPLFDYGPAAGLAELRTAIAEVVCPRRGLHPDPRQVIIVAGSQQALDLSARLFVDAGDIVMLEEPHYQGARALFSAAAARLVTCAVDEQGLDVERLPADGGGIRLLYVTPSHQFPSGGVLPLPRRLALLEWAAAHGVVVLEDDYDSEFRYDARPVEAIRALDRAGVVVYIGTFAKTLYPALRIGFIVVPQRWVELFERAKWLSDRGVPSFDQQVLAAFIGEGHYERHLRRMSRRYAARRQALVDALQQHFDAGMRVAGASAGAHVVVWLEHLAADRLEPLLAAGAANGVGLYPIAPYYLRPPQQAGLLFGYGSIEESAIGEGVRRFAAAARTVAGARG